MKITIDRADLMRALSHVQSVVERRNTIPILSNVRLDAKDGMLTLTATDMDLEINESVAANVAAEGSTTTPAHTLHDIVRKLPDDAKVDLALEPGGAMMTVTSGRSKFKLSCLPVSDFPELGTGDMASTLAIPAKDLRELIDRTRFAVSNDETRYYLNGIYVHAAESNGVSVLRAVATDGHRLAQFEMPLPEGAADMPGVIIPRKTVAEIRKLIEEAADVITINLSENKVRFEFDHVKMTSKLIDGTFPDYQKVIPQGNDKIVEVNPKLFTSAIDRVSTISSEKTRAVKLAIDGSTMTLSAQSADSGSATEDIEISNDNASLEIGFNSKYLLDITAQMSSDRCRIILADSGGPTIIQDTEDSSSLYVLMPLRV
ncbi:MAG: DNA polymerase III subunit beta [Alphaproteobacteria bacterium]|nr:MAG: DNA polymerase III subunit beta [Alphaproteobacteria bacterium]